MKTKLMTALLTALLFVQPVMATTNEWADDEPANKRAADNDRIYQDATNALDEGDWRTAAGLFAHLAAAGGQQADAAHYWLAYARNRMGQRSEALSALLDLQKKYPRSKWTKDGRALEVEIRQSSGQSIAPENVTDEDLKLMALNGLMHTDPERAIPTLEKVIAGNSTQKVKDRAVFILSQSSSPKALDILGRLARDGSRPEVQAKTLKYLGIMGGEGSRRMLGDIYASTTDVKVKQTILKSYMVSGDRARLLSLAKSETNSQLRAEAVSQLGILGAKDELSGLYDGEQSEDVRKQIIKAMFLGGNADKLLDIAKNEKVVDLRLAAIKNLGLLGGKSSGQALVSIYETDSNHEVRRSVVKGLFLQQNATALVALARKEKDPSLKKDIIKNLSLINSAEATDYLMEYLQ